MININSLAEVTELFDGDLYYVNNSFATTGLSIKDYANSQTSPVIDADTILRANFNTGQASYTSALNLKNYVNNVSSSVVGSDFIPVFRGGDVFKAKALTIKAYCLGTVVDFLPIVVMAGQSNMEGDNSDTTALSAPYVGALTNAKVYFKNTTSGTTNGVIQNLQNGVNNNWRSATLSSNGPEIGVGYHLPLLISHQIGIIKYSLGGSRLVDDGVTVSNAGLWDVDGNASRAGAFGLHFPILVNNFVKPALQKYIDAGFNPRLYAFSWCQGEADATIQYCADNYQTKLVQLLNQFKIDLQPFEPNVVNMNVIITRIHNNFNPGTRPYLTEVRTAQENVGNTYANALWLNSDSYAVKTDNIHWTRQAQAAQHGQAVAIELANIYNS